MKLIKPKHTPEEKTLVTFRLELSLYDPFAKACDATGISLSEGLRQLIQSFLKVKPNP